MQVSISEAIEAELLRHGPRDFLKPPFETAFASEIGVDL